MMQGSEIVSEIMQPKFSSVQFFSKTCEPWTWLKFSSANLRLNLGEHIVMQ